LSLAGLSSRMLSQLSKQLLGIRVSPQEVSNAMKTIAPMAKEFLTRRLEGRTWVYLYVDGTNCAKETIAGLETRGCPQDVRDTGKELSCSSRLEKSPRLSCEKDTRRP
jgi:hypothetical protein